MVGSDWTNIFNKTLAFGAIALLILTFFSIISFGHIREDLVIIVSGVLLVVSISFVIGLIAESPIMIQFENGKLKRKVLIACALAIIGMFVGAILAAGMTLIYGFLFARDFFLFLLRDDPLFLLFEMIGNVLIGTPTGAFIGGMWPWMRLY